MAWFCFYIFNCGMYQAAAYHTERFEWRMRRKSLLAVSTVINFTGYWTGNKKRLVPELWQLAFSAHYLANADLGHHQCTLEACTVVYCITKVCRIVVGASVDVNLPRIARCLVYFASHCILPAKLRFLTRYFAHLTKCM
jgi:hypothetical protein